MKIYNTLSKKIELFKPINENKVTIYTCGPTVYDHAHIGHWYTYVRMDILVRTIRENNFKPFWVMNITDVGHLTSDQDEGEDKIQNKANKERKSAWEIAKIYTSEFRNSMKKLNILEPNLIVKATDHIEDQIDFIVKLEKKGYCYEIKNDGIYFDISKFKDYAKFGNLDLDEQQVGKRIKINPLKRNPQDFALWKYSPLNQKRDMEWESPWGKGFPGWHIECSAMSMKYLGETLDIHTGGIDHISVHHTNEIAQSQSLTGKPLAHYWIHSNHVMINENKISKSLNNGITLEDISQLGYSHEDLRLQILESHYQSQSKFSYKSLKSAKNRLINLKSMAVLRYQAADSAQDFPTFSFHQAYIDLKDLVSNNLNTPQALAFLSALSNQLLITGITKNMLLDFELFLDNIDKLLGLKLHQVRDIKPEYRQLILKRNEARKRNAFNESDQIRNELQNNNILLRDYPDRSIWRWIN